MLEISLQDIEIDFGFKKVLKGASFTVNSGEKVALVGNNGSGKSTLLRIIMGIQKFDKGLFTLRKGATLGYLEQESDIGGDVTVEAFIKEAQQPIFDIERQLRRLEERMEFGGKYAQLMDEFLAKDGYETDENFSKICSAFKLDGEMLAKKCAELSGGQKTIVKLAKVLLQAPDILLLDEPTNHLDIDTLVWLEGFVRGYRGTVLIVSHDRYFMDKTVKKTIMLYEGQAEVYNGNYSFSLQEQERLMMLEFEKYKDQQKKIEAMREAIKRFKRFGEMAPQDARHMRRAANMQKRIDKMEKIEKPKLEREKLPIHFEMGRRSGKRVLTVSDLSFAYGERQLFENAGMELLFQERLCLLGANGVGKTTILRLLFGQIEPQRGEIVLAESAKVGYIEQEITFADENATILDAFKEDAKLHENDARKVLAKYFITRDEVYKRLGKLSGGERVILRLAMLMQREVNLLIMDEPTNHLDIDTKELLEESLADYKGTLLFISHDRYFINRLATRIVCIGDGGLQSVEGDFDDFFAGRYD